MTGNNLVADPAGRHHEIGQAAIIRPMDGTRRGFLRSAGLTSLGAGTATAGAIFADASPAHAATAGAAGEALAFHGPHQAGIATPAQDHLQFAALDMVSRSVADLRDLMRTWSSAAALMAAGKAIGPVETGAKPAGDTGEALGLHAANLTMTFGFGPSLFSNGDRFGLAAHRPAPLVDVPAFRHDALRAPISGGDLGVQVCADDPQVAFHAVHELIRLAKPVARPRWLLAGFGRTGNSRHQSMPRNLMGFFDGTANIKVENGSALKKSVWAAGPASPAWMHGGSYLVARRIEIALGAWDETAVTTQEHTIGRHKESGKLLSDIPVRSHILLSSPGANNGVKILRRGYSYVDGIDRSSGAPAVGLLFLCYQRDPRHQFIPIQRQLAARDSLNQFISHIGSAIFACPPGAASGSYVGETLLG
jgi:deferrochelatase/peroxidase EfeB